MHTIGRLGSHKPGRMGRTGQLVSQGRGMEATQATASLRDCHCIIRLPTELHRTSGIDAREEGSVSLKGETAFLLV